MKNKKKKNEKKTYAAQTTFPSFGPLVSVDGHRSLLTAWEREWEREWEWEWEWCWWGGWVGEWEWEWGWCWWWWWWWQSGGEVAAVIVVIVVGDGGGGGNDELAKCGDAAMCFVITPAGMLCIALITLTCKDSLV